MSNAAIILNEYINESGKLLVERIREDFPILQQYINGKPLIYFDNAATTQKPQQVIDSLVAYYSSINANIHRGIHTLAERSTTAYEQTRESVRNFLNASSTDQIVFTRGTTESINLVASTYGRANVKKGDEILISGMEHHSNMVPWLMLAEEKDAIVKIIPVDENGELELEVFENLLNEKTKIVAVNHASNSLGTINPIKYLVEKAHRMGAITMIDGAQSGPHLAIDVQDLDADFYAISSHKFYGPTGIGALYGKRHLLDSMPAYQGGGEMIKDVFYDKFSVNDLPYKFEAGTPNIADTIAWKTAIDYMESVGRDAIRDHENKLLQHATNKINEINGVRVIGCAKNKVSVLSFVIENIHPQDIGILMDQEGVALRTGNHCTQPLMAKFCIPGTARASFAMYNTMDEIDIMIESLKKSIKMLR